MDENPEQMMAELVAGLGPEEYERLGPALREFGLALAELRQAESGAQRMHATYARALEVIERWRDARDRMLEDRARAEQRLERIRRLLEDAL